jgi:hypothetical protein
MTELFDSPNGEFPTSVNDKLQHVDLSDRIRDVRTSRWRNRTADGVNRDVLARYGAER